MKRETILALLMSLSLALGATPVLWSQSHLRIIQPDLVRQGETFTGVVVEETPAGDVPLEHGNVVFRGQVLPIESGGRVKFPAFVKETGDAFVDVQVVRVPDSSPASLMPHRFEVVPLQATLHTKIAAVSNIVNPGGRIQVTGQGLDAMQRAALTDSRGAWIDLGDSVGSSLQRLAVVPRNLPPGTYRFVAWDADGNRYEAPNQSYCPTLQLEGTRITHRGQRGTITVLSDTDGTVLLSGGEPQIILDQRTIAVHVGQPARVKFTARQTGNYIAQARLINPDDVPAPPEMQRVETRLEVVQMQYDAASNQTNTIVAMRVMAEGGRAAADVPIDVALVYPNGIEYGHALTDQRGRVTLMQTLPGRIVADVFSAYAFRVPALRWTQDGEPPVHRDCRCHVAKGGGIAKLTATKSNMLEPGEIDVDAAFDGQQERDGWTRGRKDRPVFETFLGAVAINFRTNATTVEAEGSEGQMTVRRTVRLSVSAGSQYDFQIFRKGANGKFVPVNSRTDSGVLNCDHGSVTLDAVSEEYRVEVWRRNQTDAIPDSTRIDVDVSVVVDPCRHEAHEKASYQLRFAVTGGIKMLDSVERMP